MKTQFRPITIIFLAACILLLAACGSTEAAPTPTPVPTPTPTPKALSPEEIIDLSTQASRDTPMHMVMDMQMNMKVAEQDVAFAMNMDMDVNSKEEAQMTMTMDVLGQTVTMETVIVGGKVYLKQPGSDQWIATDQVPSDALRSSQPFDVEGFQDITLVGEETVDGIPVYHYRVKVPFPESITAQLGSIEGLMDVDYYIAKDTYLPVKMAGGGELTVDVSGVATNVTFTMNALFSNWGQEVEITAPIP